MLADRLHELLPCSVEQQQFVQLSAQWRDVTESLWALPQHLLLQPEQVEVAIHHQRPDYSLFTAVRTAQSGFCHLPYRIHWIWKSGSVRISIQFALGTENIMSIQCNFPHAKSWLRSAHCCKNGIIDIILYRNRCSSHYWHLKSVTLVCSFILPHKLVPQLQVLYAVNAGYGCTGHCDVKPGLDLLVFIAVRSNLR